MPETEKELRKALEALRESEERYRVLFSASPNALFLIGDEGRFL